MGLWRFSAINFKAELNGLFCPFRQQVKRLCLCMATCQFRNFCNKKSPLILFDDYGKFFFHHFFASLFPKNN